ncbi:phosphatidylglycerophosphatase A [Peptoniphilus sp. GNH]|nr:phosphatidylglycerophosphatase A [Clostridiales bacterium KA00134]UHR03322.1 phosphatidylglycerophosphatase A [Peptoniphilus sp. GNH]
MEYKNLDLKKISIEKLQGIGVSIEDMAKMVLDLQKPYLSELDLETCRNSVLGVLGKREVANAILTGLALDEMANKKLLPEPILSIISNDEGLYGIDEVLTLGITNVYGSIGLTNFGYLDKEKPGILRELDQRKYTKSEVTTFADDLVAAIIAAAAASIAHNFG